MLHKQSGRGYTQVVIFPDAAAPEHADVHLNVLGRLRGRGAFDLHQVSTRYSMHIIKSGQGWVVINGISAKLGPGDAFCFYPGDTIHYREDPHDPWCYSWWGMVGPLAKQRFDVLGYDRQRMQRHIATPALWRLLDEIEATFLRGGHGSARSVAAAWSLCAEMEGSANTHESIDPIRAIAAIVESGYDRGLRIEDLARDLGIDRSTLFRRFRDRYGCSPKSWLQGLRLDRAKALLASGDLTVAEVGRRCGFEDARNFTRAYVDHFGGTPGGRARATHKKDR